MLWVVLNKMLKIMKDCEQEVYDMYDTAVQQEKDWAEYLFKAVSYTHLTLPTILRV